jgi:hypothetical protein
MAEPSRGWSSRLRGTRRVGSLDLVAVLTVIAGARIAVSGEVHGVAQSRDWLVFGATTPPPDLTVNLINGTTMLSLSNGLVCSPAQFFHSLVQPVVSSGSVLKGATAAGGMCHQLCYPGGALDWIDLLHCLWNPQLVVGTWTS